MTHHWDEFSKSLAEESVPRRESLRRLGAVLAGVVLSPLGLQTASAGRSQPDPCKDYCRCRGKSDKNQCLAACRDCQQFGGRLCGSCGNYYCADLAGDRYNCGACGYACKPPGRWEEVTCMIGECQYACVYGAVLCDDGCKLLKWDADNCGDCGNVCPSSTPYCVFGACAECPPDELKCDGVCTDLAWDSFNCGACGIVCPEGSFCDTGYCYDFSSGGGPYDDYPVNP